MGNVFKLHYVQQEIFEWFKKKITIINSCKSYSQIIWGHPLNLKCLCMVSMGIEKRFKNIQLLMLAYIYFICFWNQLGKKM
jgi:hypothetical protein